MKTTLCTLYNSLYLDKGLVLYDSLKVCAKNFELYVLCMDEKCYEVLTNIGESELKPILLSDVENELMLKAKSNRSIAEYCWTCSSRLIQYILESFKPICCTYIDADMFFYHDPRILIDEMLKEGKSVMMVPHRFPKRIEKLASKVGMFCVEFNCFKNDEQGLLVLNDWHNKCLDCCSNIGDGIHWGDQKYMDEWPKHYGNVVHVCTNPGAGVAPWNVELYNKFDPSSYSLFYKIDGKKINLIFYHFQSIKYLSLTNISTGVSSNNSNIDYEFVDCIYYDYLKLLGKRKDFLKYNYNLNLIINEHPSNEKRGKSFLFDKLLLRIWRLAFRFFISRPYIIKIH